MAAPIDPSIPLHLLYKPQSTDERIVVSFPHGLKDKAVFGAEDFFLEAAMKTTGIPIPTDQRDLYPEFQKNTSRRAIFLDDASFGKAFYDVYFRHNMNPDLFKWKKSLKET